jgi:hypothetical protein
MLSNVLMFDFDTRILLAPEAARIATVGNPILASDGREKIAEIQFENRTTPDVGCSVVTNR